MRCLVTARLLAACAVMVIAGAADAQLLSFSTVRDGRVEAELIAQHTAVVPGETARLGLRLKMDVGWHTYWKNPGDSGVATEVEWDLPEGFVAHGIDWPVPDYFESGGLAGFGYENEIVLPMLIEVPETIQEGRITLQATADWLVCKESCEPGAAELSITLPVTKNPANVQRDAQHHALFTWAKRRTPLRLADGATEAEWTGDAVRLSVREFLISPDEISVDRAADLSVRFFPLDPQAIAMSGTQELKSVHRNGFTLELPGNPIYAPPSRLQGVLVIGSQTPIEIDLPVRGVAASENQ